MKKLISLCALFMLVSCGYVGEEPIDTTHYESEITKTECKTDPGALSAFLDEILTDEINCLESNLTKYADSVQGSDRDYITKEDLERFVRRFFKAEHVDKTLDSMELFYQLVRLILQDNYGRLAVVNLPKMIDLLRVANQEFVTLNDVFSNLKERKENGLLWTERYRATSAVRRFSNSVLELIENSPGHKKALKTGRFAQIDLADLLSNINKKLSSEKQIEQGILDTAMIAKNILLGGRRRQITTVETTALLRKLPLIVEIFIDILYADEDSIKNHPNPMIAKNGLWSLYLSRLRQLQQIVYWGTETRLLFTTDDIIMMVESFIDTKDYNLNNFRACIEEAKMIFFEGEGGQFTTTDLKTLFREGIDLVSKLYFNDVTYEHYRQLLEENKAIKSLPGIVDLKLPAYQEIYSSNIDLNSAKKDFEEVAIKWRLYRNSDNQQYYKKEMVRTKYGFNETAILRFAVDRVLRYFGSPVYNTVSAEDLQQTLKFAPIIQKPEFVVTSEQLFQVLLTFKPLLEEIDLWTLHPDTFAANTLMMADLFQTSSDADDLLNTIEATQYVQLILTTLGMSSDFLDKFENTKDKYGNPVCENLTPDQDDPSYEVDCYRKYVFDFMIDTSTPCEQQPLSNLCLYAKNASAEDKVQFLFNVESFAREKGYVPDNVPMQNRDLILVLGTILNIESMMIRFDVNKNNFLDSSELDKAFILYQNIIIKKAKLEGIKKKFAKNAFLYMVTNMEMPDVMPLLWYSFSGIFVDKNPTATRKNVGMLFYYFGSL